MTGILKHSENELVELANFAAAHLMMKSSVCPRQIFSAKLLPASDTEALPAWLFLLNFLLKKQKGDAPDTAEWLSRVNKPTAFHEIDGSKESQTACRAYKNQRDALVETLQRHPGVLQARLIRLLPAAGEETKQWAFLTSLCHVLRALNAELLLAFTRYRVVDFTQAGAAANLALGAEDEPTDLALALDSSINHILVDEFQDTSQLQLNLLKKLTAGWQPEDGRTLFLVGDPMQSCYSFRNANVGIYLDVQSRGIGQIPLKHSYFKAISVLSSPSLIGLTPLLPMPFPCRVTFQGSSTLQPGRSHSREK